MKPERCIFGIYETTCTNTLKYRRIKVFCYENTLQFTWCKVQASSGVISAVNNLLNIFPDMQKFILWSFICNSITNVLFKKDQLVFNKCSDATQNCAHDNTDTMKTLLLLCFAVGYVINSQFLGFKISFGWKWKYASLQHMFGYHVLKRDCSENGI